MMHESDSSDHRGRAHRRVLGGRWLFLALLLLLGGLVFAGDLDQCNCNLHPESCGGGGNGTPGDGAVSGCTGAVIGCYYGPPPTGSTPTAPPTPPPPVATAGFSAGSWFGTYPPPGYQSQQPPNASYRYAILDASNGPSSSIRLCGDSETFSPRFSGGAQTIVDHPDGYAYQLQAFWFLTSVAYAHNVCSRNDTPVAWGQQQADWFALELDLQPAAVRDQILMTLADIEIVSDDIAEWEQSSFTDNQAVIASFFARLCDDDYCFRGIYAGPFTWWDIIGPYQDQPSQPYLGTSWLWLASAGPVDLNGGTALSLNTQQDLFTVKPGGYYIWSWQYATDSCEMSFALAQDWSNEANPPMRAFDKWTNSDPEDVCS
jgi:hypothetical protein